MAKKAKSVKKAAKKAKKKAAKKKASKKGTKKKVARKEHKETKRARLARKHARSSVKSLSGAFDAVRTARGATGAPTDGDQDLLRAAVVFAAGGLDITIKELIRGSLRKLASSDEDVRDQFEKFTRGQLKSNPEVGGKTDPAKFLAQLLVSESPYEKLIDGYIYNLTGSSLQSTDELFRAAAALDLNTKHLKENKANLKAAFDTRNNIIHELDVNFGGGTGQRQRKSRTKPQLEEQWTLLLETTDYFVKETEKKLEECM